MGFFILKQVSDSGSSSGSPPSATDGTTATTVRTSTATTTPATVNKASFQVVVANASGVGGAAGKMTTDLQASGYKTLKATNVAAGTPQAATTTVYYTTGSQAAADAVLAELGLAGPAQPIPATGFVVPEANRAGANVVIVLGKDLAGKALPAPTADRPDDGTRHGHVAGGWHEPELGDDRRLIPQPASSSDTTSSTHSSVSQRARSSPKRSTSE